MRNKAIIPFLFLFSAILLLSACGNKEYDQAMENGMDSIKNEKYEEAVDFFQEALDEKEGDDKASTYLEQTELLIEGMEFMSDSDLDEAKIGRASCREREESTVSGGAVGVKNWRRK